MTTFIVSFSQAKSACPHARQTQPVTRWVKDNSQSVTKSPYLRVGHHIYTRLDFSDDAAAVHFKLSDVGGEMHQPANPERSWEWVLKSYALDHCHETNDAVHEDYSLITYWHSAHPWDLPASLKGRINQAYERHLVEETLAEEIERERVLRAQRYDWTQMANLMDQFGIPLTRKPPAGLFDN